MAATPSGGSTREEGLLEHASAGEPLDVAKVDDVFARFGLPTQLD